MDTILGWGVTIGWGLAIFSGRNVRGSYCPAKEGKRTATISPVFRLSNCFRPFYLTNCGLYYPETLPTGVPSGRSKRVTIGAKICSRLPIPSDRESERVKEGVTVSTDVEVVVLDPDLDRWDGWTLMRTIEGKRKGRKRIFVRVYPVWGQRSSFGIVVPLFEVRVRG
jgi:hypothetical protein